MVALIKSYHLKVLFNIWFNFKISKSSDTTCLNVENSECEPLDDHLFDTFNIFYIKLKDDARLFNYLCFMMLEKQKQSIVFVKQLERIDAGKLNFFIKELIYLYGKPKEIKYSNANLTPAFREIECSKIEMSHSEKTNWFNSVESFFEESYSHFDILNFVSNWNQKGLTLKSILLIEDKCVNHKRLRDQNPDDTYKKSASIDEDLEDEMEETSNKKAKLTENRSLASSKKNNASLNGSLAKGNDYSSKMVCVFYTKISIFLMFFNSFF